MRDQTGNKGVRQWVLGTLTCLSQGWDMRANAQAHRAPPLSLAHIATCKGPGLPEWKQSGAFPGEARNLDFK